jgi:hypothetical protein
MAKEHCFKQLLSQLLRSIVDENTPAMTEVIRLHTFISQLDSLETHNPSYALDALEDWVPRLLRGIENSPQVTIIHPPAMQLSTNIQSNPFMDLLEDAMATVPSQPAVPEPRFTVVEVLSHIITEEGRLAFWVLWQGETGYDLEQYQNLHHLRIFMDYEVSLLPTGRPSSAKAKAVHNAYNQYIALRNKEHSMLTEEYDTEEEDDIVIITDPEQLPSAFDNFSSDDTMSWGDLLLDEDMFMPSSLDLGGSFGDAGPSHQGEPFDWTKLDL